MNRIQSCTNSTNKDSGYCFGPEHVAEIVAQLESDDTPSTVIEAVYGRKKNLLGGRLNAGTDSKLRHVRK